MHEVGSMKKKFLLDRRSFFKQSALLSGLPLLAGKGLSRQDKGPGISYVDGLCFMPPDLATVRASGLTAFIADVSAGSRVKTESGERRYVRSFELCARSITAVRRRLRESEETMFLATRGAQILEAKKDGRTAVFLQFQGCEPIGEDLSRIDLFYELGLRILQITHHFDNPIGGGALERKPTGLTSLGFEAVARMNELAIIPDLSHASDLTAADVLKTSKEPVILSHGAARALVNNARCAPDEVIRGIADSGGVMGVFMLSFWLTNDSQATVDHLIRHIRRVIQIGGIDSVGIANDGQIAGDASLNELSQEEAVKGLMPWWRSIREKGGILGFDTDPKHVVIPELNHVARMATIHRALEKAGFNASETEKIMGGNWIRVLTDSLA